MTRTFSIPEYRFVVPGRAVSFRSRHANAYKSRVKRIAKEALRRPLRGQQLQVHMDYFHCGARQADMDNVAKCVLDALTGVAYLDDKQVALQVTKAYSLHSVVVIPGGPVDLVKPLAEHDEYLFVRVRDGPARSEKRAR